MTKPDRHLLDALVRTKELIATQDRWCQGTLGMVEGNKPLGRTIDIDTDLGIVRQLCVQGAARVATLRGPLCLEDVTGALDQAAAALYPSDHAIWERIEHEGDDPHVAVNDGMGFEATHQMLDCAIAEMKVLDAQPDRG